MPKAVRRWGSAQDSIAGIEKQIETRPDRIVKATTASLMSAYEQRIAAREREKTLAAEKSASMGRPRHTLEDSFEHATCLLTSPSKTWVSGRLTLKRTNPQTDLCGSHQLLP